MEDLLTAVRAQIARWELEDHALAATAVDIARRLQHPRTSPTAAAMLHGRLIECLEKLEALAPPQEAQDTVAALAQEYEGLRAVK